MKPDAGDRDDVALLRAVARGDEEALAALYDRHVGWLTVRLTWRCLAEPPATAHDVTIAWYAVASAALALTCVAMRDQWHRYSRSLHLLLHR